MHCNMSIIVPLYFSTIYSSLVVEVETGIQNIQQPRVVTFTQYTPNKDCSELPFATDRIYGNDDSKNVN